MSIGYLWEWNWFFKDLCYLPGLLEKIVKNVNVMRFDVDRYYALWMLKLRLTIMLYYLLSFASIIESFILKKQKFLLLTTNLSTPWRPGRFYRKLAWVTRRCPGWFKIGIKKSIETQEPSPPLEDHLCAKFRPDPSSRLDFYREHTDTQTHRQTHRHCPLCIRWLGTLHLHFGDCPSTD